MLFNRINCILLLVVFSACKADSQATSKKSSACDIRVASYYFGVEKLSVAQQVTTLKNLKMDAIMVDITEKNIDSLDKYYQTEEVKKGQFHLYDIWTSVSVNSEAKLTTQLKTVETIYQKIQNKETQLQVIFSEQSTPENITRIVSLVTDIAKKYNKNLIIYPHFGNTIATTEQALIYLKAVNKPNIFIAMHLCHELRAGNGHRIKEVVNNLAPYIKAVSISGASESERLDQTLPNWYFGIKPLFMGDYDLLPYYKAVIDTGYKGPITLHTWGIDRNFKLSPQDNLPKSREFLLNLTNKICIQ
jgi:hypothetical protein